MAIPVAITINLFEHNQLELIRGGELAQRIVRRFVLGAFNWRAFVCTLK